MGERFVTASHAARWGLIRAHNGVGWLWCSPDVFDRYAEDTRQALARGEVPPPPVPEVEIEDIRPSDWLEKAAEDLCTLIGTPHTHSEDGDTWRSIHFDKCLAILRRHRDAASPFGSPVWPEAKE